MSFFVYFFVINLRKYGHLRSHDCLGVKVSFTCTRNSLSRKSQFNVLNCEDGTHQSNCPLRFSQLLARYLKQQKLMF